MMIFILLILRYVMGDLETIDLDEHCNISTYHNVELSTHANKNIAKTNTICHQHEHANK